MNCSVNIGKSSYVITVLDKGGKVLVRKGNKIVLRGQWIPPYKKLMLNNCPFPALHEKIQKAIAECDTSMVQWPYVSEKYR